MKLVPQIGVLYDTLAYLTAYFADQTKELFTDHEDAIIFDAVSSLPKIIAPFFFTRENVPAPLTGYLLHKPSVLDIDSLAELLSDEDERDVLRENVICALFDPETPADGFRTDCSMKTAMRLDKTDFSADFKYQALLCLTYFRHAVTELCRTLGEVADTVEKLHGKYDADCTAVFSEIRSGRYDRLYTASGFDPAVYDEITVSFSILRPDLLRFHTDENSLFLLAGIRHTDTLIRAFAEDSIDLDRFLDNFGNEIRRMILEALAENGEMTASDLSRTTGIPVTTVLRHIEALTEDYLLSVSRRKGLQIFYMLNREYIDKARRKMDRYLAKLAGIE